MLMIWYNPELKQYQKGDEKELELQRKNSPLADSFRILYIFNPTSGRLIDQIFFALCRHQNKINPATINA